MTKPVKSVKVVHDKDTNEWICKAYDEQGKRLPNADYFAADKKDAEDTAKLMVK